MTNLTTDRTETRVSAPTLRRATPDDVEAIAALWHSGWSDAHLGHVPEAIQQYRRLVGFRQRVPGRIQQKTLALSEAGSR